MKEEELPGRRYKRCVAFGVYEGLHQADSAGTRQQGVWGGRLASDLEVADAEMAAIHEYLWKVVRDAGAEAATRRVLVQSDCLGALDAIEAAWRAGNAEGLRRRDRGAMLESVCRARAQLDRVIFMFTPSHKGTAPNAMADAAAKSWLERQPPAGVDRAIIANVQARPVVYEAVSDFTSHGILRQDGEAATGAPVLLDRRLFPSARRRLARWLHTHMAAGLSDPNAHVDMTFVGRRSHTHEARSYLAVTKAGVACAKLDRKEQDPVGRMAEDNARIAVVMAARNGKFLGLKGAHDESWRRARG